MSNGVEKMWTKQAESFPTDHVIHSSQSPISYSSLPQVSDESGEGEERVLNVDISATGHFVEWHVETLRQLHRRQKNHMIGMRLYSMIFIRSFDLNFI